MRPMTHDRVRGVRVKSQHTFLPFLKKFENFRKFCAEFGCAKVIGRRPHPHPNPTHPPHPPHPPLLIHSISDWVRVLTVCSDPRKGGRKKPSRQIGGSAFFDHLFEPWKRWSKKAEPPHWRFGFFRPPFCTHSREIPAPVDELSEAYLRARPLWTGRHPPRP